jgi:Cell division protein
VRLEVLKKESLQIASAAKKGVDTSGFEVALNRGGTLPTATRVASIQPASGVLPPRQDIIQEPLYTPTPSGYDKVIPGHLKEGEFYPDPIITEMPVTKTDIFIQAGSFSVADNARKFSKVIGSFGKADIYPALVRGQQYYRVKIGPIATVNEADIILARLDRAGHDAIIVVD